MIVGAEQSIPDRQLDSEILIPMSRIDTVMDLMVGRTHEQPIEHRTIGEPDMRMAQMRPQQTEHKISVPDCESGAHVREH